MSARMDCRDCSCTWMLSADLKTRPCSHPLPWQLHPAPPGQQPEKPLVCVKDTKIVKGTERLVHTLLTHISKLWASSRDSITLPRNLQRGPVCIYFCRQARTVCDLALDTLNKNKHFHHSHSAASNSIHCLSINFSGLITSNHVWLRHVSKLKVQQQGMRWMRIWLARCHGLTLASS